MLTNKIRPVVAAVGLGLLALVLAGCGPAGTRSLLDGSRLLKKGQPDAAVVRLEEAVQHLPTNTLAWAYLAVARHEAGSLSNAQTAYRQAIQLSPDMVECRSGLGTLHWQQGQWADAREQFAAVTVLRPDHAGAWLRLGECQSRLGDVRGALMSLSRAVTLDGKSAEAWNWLGLAQVQAGQWRDAEASFQKALDQQMNHAPALLNLAVLRQQRLNQPRDALDLYRQYLAYWPSAGNAAEVRTVAARLEQQLAPAVPPSPPPATVIQPTAKVVTSQPPPTSPAPVSPRPVAARPPPAKETSTPRVAVAPAPVVEAAPRNPVAETPAVAAPPVTAPPPLETPASSAPPPPRKRSLLSKLNPVNLFKANPDDAAGAIQPTDSASATPLAQSTPSRTQVSPPVSVGVPGTERFPRYAYRVGASFVEGDASAAEKLYREAERLRLRGQLAEATERSRAAIRANPASYEAHFSLGLVALQSGDLPQALSAFEAATVIRPNSDAARYNLGLALKQAGYPVDAAEEMLRLLQRDPNDVRAHLMLGNLYDRPFGMKSRARSHYQRVLEIAPSHPEAATIRFWLKQNPA